MVFLIKCYISASCPLPAGLVVVAELGLLAELITVLLPLGGAFEVEEEEDRPPSTESSSSKFLSATTEAENILQCHSSFKTGNMPFRIMLNVIHMAAGEDQ